jgi:hypothetical protein
VSAVPAPERQPAGWHAGAQWAEIAAAVPRVAATMRRYLRQLGTFLAPASVDAAENALRQLACWMITEAGLAAVSDIRRDDIEDYKVWLATRSRAGGRTITMETHRQRTRTVRQFFERIIEWDWPDAPPRNPVIAGDIPKKPCWMRASGWRAPSAIGSAREPRCSTAAASRWARSASPKAAGT